METSGLLEEVFSRFCIVVSSWLFIFSSIFSSFSAVGVVRSHRFPDVPMRLLFRVIPSSLLSLLWKSEVKRGDIDDFDWKKDSCFCSRCENVLFLGKSSGHRDPVAQMAVAFRVMTPAPLSCFSTRDVVESITRKEGRTQLEMRKEKCFDESRREDHGCLPQGPLGEVGIMSAVPLSGSFCFSDSTNYKPTLEKAGNAVDNPSVEEECGDSAKGTRKESSLFLPPELEKIAVECVGSASSPHWIPFLLSRLAAAASLDHPAFYPAAGLPKEVRMKRETTVCKRTKGSVAQSAPCVGTAMRWWPASRSEVRQKSKGRTALSLTHENWVAAAIAWNSTSPAGMKCEGEINTNVASSVRFGVDVVDVAAMQRLHHKYPAKFHSRMLPQCWLSPPSSPMEREGKENVETYWRTWLQETAMTSDFPFSPWTTVNSSSSSQDEKEMDSERVPEHKRCTSRCVSSFLSRHANNDISTAVGAITLSQHWSLRECIIKLIGIPQRSFPYDQVKTSDAFTTPSFFPFSSSSARIALPLPRGILQPFQVYHTTVPFDSSLPSVFRCSSCRSSRSPSSFSVPAADSIARSPWVSIKCITWVEWYAVPLLKMPSIPHTSLSSSYSFPPIPFSSPTSFSGNKVKHSKNMHTRVPSYQPSSLVSTVGRSEKKMQNIREKCLKRLSEEHQWEWRPHVITVAMSLQ